MVRLSVGIEHSDDIIHDLSQVGVCKIPAILGHIILKKITRKIHILQLGPT